MGPRRPPTSLLPPLEPLESGLLCPSVADGLPHPTPTQESRRQGRGSPLTPARLGTPTPPEEASCWVGRQSLRCPPRPFTLMHLSEATTQEGQIQPTVALASGGPTVCCGVEGKWPLLTMAPRLQGRAQN